MALNSTKKKPHKGDGEDGNALFVRGLAPNATGEQLEQLFSGVGPIRRTFVVTKGPKCTGSGFVHFALREDAQKAQRALDGATLGGRRLRVEYARPRNRQGDTGDSDGGLRKKTTPKPAAQQLRGNPAGSVATRTVVVTRRDSAKALLDEISLRALLPTTKPEEVIVSADGTSARLLFPSWPAAGKAAATIHGNEYDAVVDALRGGRRARLIVRNLPFKVDAAEVRDCFEKIAPVRNVDIPTAKDAKVEKDMGSVVRCRGFGFVEYFMAADANRAVVKLNGTQIGGRVVAVDAAIGRAEFVEANRGEQDDGEGVLAEVEKAVKEEEELEKDEEDVDVAVDEEKEEKKAPPQKAAASSDEEMGRTVFIRNLLFETSAPNLWSTIEERYGRVEQCVLVKDAKTGRSRGTAFVRFVDATDAERAENDKAPFTLEGRELLIVRATGREKARDLVVGSKAETDPRNMRLAWVGHIKADSAEGSKLSAGDIAKREKADAEKRDKLSKNPNAFVSEIRLSVRNLPRVCDEKMLKHLSIAVLKGVKIRGPAVTHVKIVRDAGRADRSKGYGFVQFAEHRLALQALHKLNNNPKVLECLIEARPRALQIDETKKRYLREEWGADRRLIVEFSVEDRRQVAVIDRIKERGRAIKEAAAANAEKRDGDGVGRKRKPRGRDHMDKRRRVDKNESKPFSAPAKEKKGGDSSEKKGRWGGDGGGKKGNGGRAKSEALKVENRAIEKTKVSKKTSKKQKKESNDRFESMLSMYKQKLKGNASS